MRRLMTFVVLLSGGNHMLEATPKLLYRLTSAERGTLIRHARSTSLAASTFPLAVAVLPSALPAPLGEAVGVASLLVPGCGAASRTSIALPAIPVRADPEDRLACNAAASPVAEQLLRHETPSVSAGGAEQRQPIRAPRGQWCPITHDCRRGCSDCGSPSCNSSATWCNIFRTYLAARWRRRGGAQMRTNATLRA